MDGQRRINCETIINFRDLGGYACRDGGVTQFGRLFRFGLPATPPPADVETFIRHGIRNIFDLRSAVEKKKKMNPFAANSNFHYAEIPLYEMNPTFVLNSGQLWGIYKHSIDRYQPQYAAVLRGILAAEGPSAFHCHGGKDRTGILAALLLSLAGVEQEDILADYTVSATYLEAYYGRQPKQGFSPFRKDKYTVSEPELMERFLAYLEDNYKGVSGYMRAVGLSQREIDGLAGLLQ